MLLCMFCDISYHIICHSAQTILLMVPLLDQVFSPFLASRSLGSRIACIIFVRIMACSPHNTSYWPTAAETDFEEDWSTSCLQSGVAQTRKTTTSQPSLTTRQTATGVGARPARSSRSSAGLKPQWPSDRTVAVSWQATWRWTSTASGRSTCPRPMQRSRSTGRRS